MATTLPRALLTRIGDGNGDVHHFFRNLHTLVFEEVDFGVPRFSRGVLLHYLLSQLETAILSRRSYGINLKKIAFRCCSGVGDHNREQWEHLAKKVELHHSGEKFSDTDEDDYLSESDITQIDEDDEGLDE
ncbi:uncharacterized protein LAESUDRAFT_750218 [Laetiporus sulphureus 93-53]|uniref:Uncharacterized protein n=1 Tax=Laetiporus sulphureus 93-53 TaxID=1314785 RepID=A0A165E2C9_9APHY|nr:uncharacterized protein LAESUDRAFT_750218 [Laetiporus sulphureus 93-53]KZT06111.1 hypothetical protein LAESUDRAFT_750218 [Laetiporus sulphureus 93-53]